MNKKYILMMLLPLCISSVSASAQMPDIKEGLWEIRSQGSIIGMQMEIPEMKIEKCFTQESMSPENILQQNNCQMKNLDIQANKASWTMSCQQQGMKMEGAGNIQYQKTSFSGTFDLTMSGSSSAGAMGMKTTLDGRYIGNCR